MKREKALEMLGLQNAAVTVSRESVMEAFRTAVKKAHPDSASESNGTEHTVQDLTMARKTLLESLDGTDLCCRLCRGRGMVRSGMGFRKCVACGGLGERK